MGDNEYSGWLEIEKVDASRQIVVGVASTPAVDMDNEIVSADAIRAALPDFMKWANLREMHTPSAVGVVQKAEVQSSGALRIVAKIVDRDAWEKVKAGVYKGFSIGGRGLEWEMEKVGEKNVRKYTKMLLSEISLVDRPANPEAKILLWKGVGMTDDVEEVQKAAPDAGKALAMLQALRDQAETDGNLEAAKALTQAIALAMVGTGGAEKPAPPEEDEETPADEAAETSEEQAAEDAAGTEMHNPDGSLKDAGALKSVQAELTKLAEATSELQKMSGALGKIEERLAKLEAQPAPGGPVLRAVDKVLASGQSSPAGSQAERSQLESRLSEARRLAVTEPDPLKKAAYQSDVNALEARLAKLA